MEDVSKLLVNLMHIDVQFHLKDHPMIVDVEDSQLLDLAAPVDDEANYSAEVHETKLERILDSWPLDAAICVKAGIPERQRSCRLFDAKNLWLHSRLLGLDILVLSV